MNVVLCALVLVSGLSTGAHATSSDDAAARLDAVSREVVATNHAFDRTALRQEGPSVMQDRLARIGHGFWSALIPGWSQYRSGHDRRAIAFASAEVVIWSTWIFSEFQGRYREDQYREFAQVYAGVPNVDRDDEDYWRAVGANVDAEQYNEAQRIENRAARDEQELNGEPVTIGLDDGTFGEDAAWEWTSERRQIEYVERRSDAIAAFDRADFVLLFAVLNRVVAVADAVRSGPPGPGDDGSTSLIEAGGFRVGVDFDPRPDDPSATLRLGRSF